MVIPSLPEELLAQIMSHLRPSTCHVRGLEYDWRPRLFDKVPMGPYSESAKPVNKRQYDDSQALRRTLASCMQTNRVLHRLAKAVYYETVDAKQLRPFMQHCMRHPESADYVREICISECDSICFSEKSLFGTEETPGYELFRSRMLGHGFKGGSEGSENLVSVAMLAAVLCTKLEKIVLADAPVVPWIWPKALSKNYSGRYGSNMSTMSRVPLSNLRTLAIQAISPVDRGPNKLPPDRWDDDYWANLLTHLPNLESIECLDGPLHVPIDDTITSGLECLTITSYPNSCVAATIRDILKRCPLLHSLDLTTRPREHQGIAPSTWSELGEILTRYGSSLRAFRFDNVLHYGIPGVLDLTSLRNLRYLSLPVDALFTMPRLHNAEIYHEPVFRGNRHGYGSAHDVEDMWAEHIKDERDIARRDGSDMAFDDDEEDEYTIPCISTRDPNVPFSCLMPDTLQHLRIMDDLDTEGVADHVDKNLRDLVSNPRFSELRDVQVRRRKVFTEHVKNIGWHLERRPFWNVMRRI